MLKHNRILVLATMVTTVVSLMWLFAGPLAAQTPDRAPDGPTLNCFPGRTPTGTTIHIRGFVWIDDTNHDGLDDSDTGIESRTDGVIVKLTCKNESTGGSDTWTTGSGDTGVTGEYSFTVNMDAIPNSNWQFELEFTPQPGSGLIPTWSNAGMDDSRDSDIDGSGSVLFMATTTSSTLEYDAGLTTIAVTSILTGTVWKESLANDVFDVGERFVSNAALSFVCDEIIPDGLTAYSGFDGNYSFNLWYDPTLNVDCPLAIVPPSGLYLVQQDVGGDDTIDSDFSQATQDLLVKIDSSVPVADFDAGLTASPPTSVVLLNEISAEATPLPVVFALFFMLLLWLTLHSARRRHNVYNRLYSSGGVEDS